MDGSSSPSIIVNAIWFECICSLSVMHIQYNFSLFFIHCQFSRVRVVLQERDGRPVVDEPELSESENLDTESENMEDSDSEEDDSSGGIYSVA